jgi:hypothetical protein
MLGTKDCFCNIHYSKYSFQDFLEEMRGNLEEDVEIVEISYPLAHNIIYGTNVFAKEHGFSIYPDFEHSQYILHEDKLMPLINRHILTAFSRILKQKILTLVH